MEAEMDRTRNTHSQIRDTQKLLLGKAEGRDHVRNYELCGKIILKRILEKKTTRFWIALRASG
jgi:hypothetical protein